MFSQLKNVVDMISLGAKEFRDFRTKKHREDGVLNLLKTYFLIKDCADEGEQLIKDAGEDPVNKIKNMHSQEAINTITKWDFILRKQGLRLHHLQGYILGQDHLDVINPELKAKISKIVGYKLDNVVTLHGIGACLAMRNMFPIQESNEKKAQLVAVMAGAEDEGVIDVKASQHEIEALRESLDGYREVIKQFITNDEFLALSKRARDETLCES